MARSSDAIRDYTERFYKRYQALFRQGWVNLYYGPDIPEPRLERALMYLRRLDIDSEQTLFLFDNKKIFGTSYVGFVLTDRAFHYVLRRNFLGELHRGYVPLDHVSTFSVVKNDQGLSNYNLLINNEIIGNLILYPDEVALLKYYFQGLIDLSSIPEIPGVELIKGSESTPTLGVVVGLTQDELDSARNLYQLVRNETETLYEEISPLLDSAWEEQLTEALLSDLRALLKILGLADRELTSTEVFPFVYVAGRFANDHQSLELFETFQHAEPVQARAMIQMLGESFRESILEMDESAPLLLPPMLRKWDRRHRADFFRRVTEAIYRFATVYIRADGVITPEEETALRRVWDKLTELPQDGEGE